MADDQGLKRTTEAKNGAATTLLGEAVERHLENATADRGRQIGLFDQGDQLPDDAGEGAAPTRTGPGRPPGSQNKATEAFRRFVRSRYGDPLLKLMERTFADPKTLAAVLGAPSGWDVAKAQAEWLIRLMPYMHSAMPAELKVQAEGRLAVAIGVVPGAVGGDRLIEADPLKALIEFAKENQQLGSLTVGQSNASQSNAAPDHDDNSEG